MTSPPGTELTADDLVAVDVRLDATADAYLSSGTRPEGRTLARAVRAGELLPRSALEEPGELVQLALPVQAGFVPPGLERGQLVDVYAVADPAAGATAVADGSVTVVVRKAPVQAISGRSEGVLSTPTTAIQVVVAVSARGRSRRAGLDRGPPAGGGGPRLGRRGRRRRRALARPAARRRPTSGPTG